MTEIYLHFPLSHYGLYANAPVSCAQPTLPLPCLLAHLPVSWPYAVIAAPILGLLAVSSGCDSEMRSLDASFDAMNVHAIYVVKDRGPVVVEVVPAPSNPTAVGGEITMHD